MGVLTDRQKRILTNAGFLPSEVKDFNEAKTPDGKPQDLAFSSAPFQDMINSRRRWISDLKKHGWNNAQIVIQIKRYYSMKSGRSPFDFLKIEYQPPKKLTDFAEATKIRTRSRISRTLGRSYGRRMAPKTLPRFLPKFRSLPVKPVV